MVRESSKELFKEIEPGRENDLEILAKTRPDVAGIIKENPDIFDFVVKKEKEKDLETGQEKEVERKHIKVLGIELEMNEEGEWTQFGARDFEGFAIDKKAIELMKIMATGIKLNQPPLIEGPTDTGKSKTLEFLSYLTNHYLLYQSFSGQTDVTELIGKYVPAVEDVRIRFEKLLENKKNLKLETIKILQKFEFDPNRLTLSLEECKQIALSESLVQPENLEKLQWNWSDGTVPRAMKYGNGRGCWLYFDELGAAEPQILVKLNRIFGGNFARITITENSQNPDIEATYPDWHQRKGELNQFRLVATTNPPSYAGREPFEKDFIRRWVYQRIGRLDKETFLARLDFVGHRRKSELPELKKQKLSEGIDLEKIPELDHILNLVISEFREQAQMKLDSKEWERGEQEFRFDDFSDALRIQKYLREMQGADLTETLKDAIRFYYLGKIESSLPFIFNVDWDEKSKTAKEKGSKKMTVKDIENAQSERVKELELLFNEILEGRTGPKIDGKSIKKKIEEEIENLNPEIKRNVLIDEIADLKQKIRIVSKEDKNWSAIQEQIKQYEKMIESLKEVEKLGKTSEDIRKGIEILEKTKREYQKLEKIVLEIQDKISKKKELENKIKFD